jgi:hypothetical protein
MIGKDIVRSGEDGMIDQGKSRKRMGALAGIANICGLMLGISLESGCAVAQQVSHTAEVSIQWDKIELVSRSTPTLQVVVNPMLRPGSTIVDGAFSAVKDLGADYVRYVPWLPYPKLGVAELEPPTSSSTSWDFSLIDPITKVFLDSTAGHSTIMNFSTIPAWLFKTPNPVTYPGAPNAVDWNYTQGTELVDPSGKALGDYYARLVSWYTKGGFTDENGKIHSSGYHYTFPYWEVLNEVEAEHQMTPQQYTARYDAIVSAIHTVSPQTKFVGMALSAPSDNPEFFDYFLNHAHHQPGTPLDYISYHFYATPTEDQTVADWQYTFFEQANRFLTTVRFVEQIRKRLSPETKTDTDELGVILPTDNRPDDAKIAIPTLYWNAAGALYAYLYIGLAQQGIDVIGESQLVGYPSQYPSVTMIDWKNAKPNARYWVLKLIKDNFQLGDQIVKTEASGNSAITAQAFVTKEGRKILLVNRRNHSVDIKLPEDASHGTLATVDEASGDGPAKVTQIAGPTIHLSPFAVAVANL